MDKHTAGPWKAQGTQVLVDGPAYRRICGGLSPADAALVSAAPDLLAALRVAVDRMEYMSEEFSDCSEELHQANAALAKATGA